MPKKKQCKSPKQAGKRAHRFSGGIKSGPAWIIFTPFNAAQAIKTMHKRTLPPRVKMKAGRPHPRSQQLARTVVGRPFVLFAQRRDCGHKGLHLIRRRADEPLVLGQHVLELLFGQPDEFVARQPAEQIGIAARAQRLGGRECVLLDRLVRGHATRPGFHCFHQNRRRGDEEGACSRP